MNGRGWFKAAAVLVAVVAGVCSAAVACSAGPAASPGPGLRGQRLEVAAVWSGVEQRHFELVLRAFTRQTGVAVTYTSAGYSVPAFLDARLARNRPPDVAFLVAGIIGGTTRAVLGVDADVFPFPAIGQPGPMVVAGGDAAVLMRRSAAGDALIRYLVTPQAAAIWSAAGGFVSPNINLGLAVYPDAISRTIAASLLQADDNFRFSLSDLTPAGFGGTEGQGMRKILQQFLVSRDVNGTAAQLEQAARKAYSP